MSRAGGKAGAVIVKRMEVVEGGGHHGGAWKVAYADFVTAMMAFFLLMWLLNATTEKQRRGLADYFAPTLSNSPTTSGSGQPFGGHTPFDTGSLVSDRGAKAIIEGKSTAMVAPDNAASEFSSQTVAPRLIDDDGDPSNEQRSTTPRTADDQQTDAADRGAQGGPASGRSDAAAGARADGNRAAPQAAPDTGDGTASLARDEQIQAAEDARAQARRAAAVRADQDRRERASLDQAAAQIRAAVRDDPALAELSRQLSVDMTPEGLRIQLLDEDKQPMFATGVAKLNDRARLLLTKIAPVLAKLSEPIAITGHTDAAPYRGGEQTNWSLSSERAEATRRLLVDSGLPEGRFRSISGVADRDPLLPADPLAAANRRIAIVALRTAAPPAPGPSPAAAAPIDASSSAALPRTAPDLPIVPRAVPAPAPSPPATSTSGTASPPPLLSPATRPARALGAAVPADGVPATGAAGAIARPPAPPAPPSAPAPRG